MTNFIKCSDIDIIDFIFKNIQIFGEERIPNDREKLINEFSLGNLAIQKFEHGFYVVARANRRHEGFVADLIHIPPHSNLMFLHVDKVFEGKGIGELLLLHAKEHYMEDQAMELVCSGETRRAYFERFGFILKSLTPQSKNIMSCPATSRC